MVYPLVQAVTILKQTPILKLYANFTVSHRLESIHVLFNIGSLSRTRLTISSADQSKSKPSIYCHKFQWNRGIACYSNDLRNQGRHKVKLLLLLEIPAKFGPGCITCLICRHVLPQLQLTEFLFQMGCPCLIVKTSFRVKVANRIDHSG
jgi:hypothetical protein